jgi:hypothetical protein
LIPRVCHTCRHNSRSCQLIAFMSWSVLISSIAKGQHVRRLKARESQMKWQQTKKLLPILPHARNTLNRSAYFAATDPAMVFLTYKIISAG